MTKMILRALNNLKRIKKIDISKRNYAIETQKCISLIYEEHGDPLKMVNLMETVLKPMGKNEVLVKMLASPINPADINIIQGVYPITPILPAIAGNEGVAEVLEVGAHVSKFKQGDWVVPAQAGWGTWRSHAVCEPESLVPVSNQLPLISAATLAINPCTAYRMLKDFSSLQEGDVVIQNAANSAVGQAVIQIAKLMGLRTVNIVRNREKVEKLVEELEKLGGTHVVTDEFARSAEMKKLFSNLPKAKLALNAVSGKAVMDLVKHMDEGSPLVTYGGMSKQPLTLTTSAFIFKDIHARGFWMTRWTSENMDTDEQKDMFQWLTAMVLDGKLLPPKHETRLVHEYREALNASMQPFQSCKQILLFQDPAHDAR